MLKRLGIAQLLVAAAILIGTGLVMVYSASALRAELRFGSSSIYLVRQLTGLIVGLGVALAVSRIPMQWIRRFGYVAWFGAILVLIATFSPLGIEANGARRWIQVGPLILQPLELVKLGTVLALAQWLAAHQNNMSDYRMAVGIPLTIAAIPAALLMLQPDFGGAMMVIIFSVTLIYIAGARWGHLIATGAVALPLLAFIAVQRSYRIFRLESFLNPWADPFGEGYQLVQSLIAFGAGGVGGSGLGAGQQKLGYLPEAHTDFILSVVGEETGLIGVVIVLGSFALLGVAAIAIASRAKDFHSMAVAVGASLLLWLQGLVNGGVAMGLLPTKGTTLPLFSYGRSSLVVSLIALGLVMNVARPGKRGRSGWR